MPDSSIIIHPLTDLPAGAELRSVSAAPATIFGRDALHVELTEEIAAHGQPDVDYVDMPTFVIVPVDFRLGTIEVDILARLTPTAPDYARAFAGLAYHLTDRGDRFEAVYLRPLNGLKLNPPPPRHGRAVQYFAYPDWKYQRLRDEYPEGTFEAGADIGPDEWIHLRLDVTESAVVSTVNGVGVLRVDDVKAPTTAGALGLFVDIGTEAYFSNLTVTPA
jgi:hypothetical protein